MIKKLYFIKLILVLFHLVIAKELVTLNETDDVKVPKNCKQHVGNETLLASCINETKTKTTVDRCNFLKVHNETEAPDFVNVNLCTHHKADLYEGDIKFTAEQEEVMKDILGKNFSYSGVYEDQEEDQHSVVKRGAARGTRKWDVTRDGANYVVPYQIVSEMNQRGREAIANAALAFQASTCIRLKPRDQSNQNDPYVNFEVRDGCWSYIGRTGGASQTISIGNGCEYTATVVHEVMHALGFFHEQSRPDRDDFVTILLENVISGTENNFQKYDQGAINSFGSPYDFDSLMHYTAYAFSKNGEPTIVYKGTDTPIQTGKKFTEEDKKQINLLYGCAKQTNVCTGGPTVVGEGSLSLVSGTYNNGAVVQLVCRYDHTAEGSTSSVCTDTQFTPPTLTCVKDSDDCTDGNSRCPRYKDSGFCSETHQNRGYMERNCQKSCEFCVKGCVNKISDEKCQDYVGRGYCEQEFVKYMQDNCAKACNCKKHCWKSELPGVTNGRIAEGDLEKHDVGAVINLSCEQGYSPTGSSTATCGRNGFNVTTFTCEKDQNSCENLSPDSSCVNWVKKGYCTQTYQGFMSRNCRKSCGLCGSAQHCAAVDLPDISGKGQIVDEKATYELGETVTFQCSSGYSPSGATSASCGEKGFDVDVFYCVPADSSCDNQETDGDCQYWLSLGYCQHSFVAFMHRSCAKTCGTCSQDASSVCGNKQNDVQCEKWKNFGYCTQLYADFMGENCSKSCSACS